MGLGDRWIKDLLSLGDLRAPAAIRKLLGEDVSASLPGNDVDDDELEYLPF